MTAKRALDNEGAVQGLFRSARDSSEAFRSSRPLSSCSRPPANDRVTLGADPDEPEQNKKGSKTN